MKTSTQEKLKKAVKAQITKELRESALDILIMSDKRFWKDFLEFHKKDQGNLCCLVIDSAKQDLVKNGKTVQLPTDQWGKDLIFNMDLNDLKEKAAEFSDSHFGSDRPAYLPLKKLSEEAAELAECLQSGEGNALDEYADCFLVLIDSFRKHFGNDVDMQILIDACSNKLDVNAAREWKYDTKTDTFKHVK